MSRDMSDIKVTFDKGSQNVQFAGDNDPTRHNEMRYTAIRSR